MKHRWHARWGWAALILGVAALLAQQIRALQAAPASGFGWLVWVLGPYLVYARWQDRPEFQNELPSSRVRWSLAFSAAAVLAGRFLLEPFPVWPLAQWLYAAGVLTGIAVLLWSWWGVPALRHFAFPLGFLLAALAWPALIESGLIGHWRVVLASGVAEFCNVLGKPAVAQGTVVQLGHATMGVEEACGGIRSLQLALIFALAAGEFRRDRLGVRCQWVVCALGLALLCNALRLLSLTWICAEFGFQTFERWHDPMGAAELAVLLAGLGALFLGWELPLRTGQSAWGTTRSTSNPDRSVALNRVGFQWAVAFVLILAASEGSVRWWFQPANPAAATAWDVALPRRAAAFADDPYTPAMASLLGCDRHELGHWTGSSGQSRAAYVLQWNQGQTARYALLQHNPEICLPRAGNRLVQARPAAVVRRGELELPFSCTEFSNESGVYYVYYLAWDLTTGKPFGLSGEIPGAHEPWFALQWREIASRRRDLSIRVVAVAIFGAPDSESADRAFRNEADQLVRIG